MTYLKNKLIEKQRRYFRRKSRVNTQVKLTSPEYRVLVFKSNLYIRADVISSEGNVIASICDKGANGATKTERAENAGMTFAETLKSKKIDKVAFDRNGYLYHGRVKAFAEGLRKWGIVL